ncbi:MAG: CPBP family intramembrane metalloprotease [Betaproteobacteria bacterium]|nr:MAG: CPBP family intramembrane metalloprotease [Betaproteobacteria bacterium]
MHGTTTSRAMRRPCPGCCTQSCSALGLARKRYFAASSLSVSPSFSAREDQGLPGVEQAAVTGLVFGTVFAVTGQLWLPMVAHAAFDVTAVALIYWNWESAVAHLLFP